MPASAASLNRIAGSSSSDLLSMLTTASVAPIIVSPVMNEVMWNNRGVQRNIQRLREDGVYVIEPSIIFGAADLVNHGRAMYGGPGTFWLGPRAVMDTIETVLRHHAAETANSNEPQPSDSAAIDNPS